MGPAARYCYVTVLTHTHMAPPPPPHPEWSDYYLQWHSEGLPTANDFDSHGAAPYIADGVPAPAACTYFRIQAALLLPLCHHFQLLLQEEGAVVKTGAINIPDPARRAQNHQANCGISV